MDTPLLLRIRYLVPFLRPSLEGQRNRLQKHLKAALGDIRIANPLSDEAATKAAAIIAHLLDASEGEAKRMSDALDLLLLELSESRRR